MTDSSSAFGSKNVTSIVFIRKTAPPPLGGLLHDDGTKNVTSRVKCASPGSHVFQRTGTIFEFNSRIEETNKTVPPTGGHVFSPIWTIFELVRDINKTYVLTMMIGQKINVFQRTGTIFELDSHWTKNVISRVLTCFHYIHIAKTAPSPGGHVFSPIWTIFELVRDINKTNVLTNFHDDWAQIVTYRVFTMKTAPFTGGHVFQRNRNHF
ncbi:hypothetical protein DPMN_082400 [Dreissena polymorpha]|uniref:Uncharacterized protein n=1 Tax=Dreissena polymorpha TaxID=45954 RepID=A0A9D3YAW9_DREPO|nr:hypothetical protein DPMN_082400 [Dreissena polymorpha]